MAFTSPYLVVVCLIYIQFTVRPLYSRLVVLVSIERTKKSTMSKSSRISSSSSRNNNNNNNMQDEHVEDEDDALMLDYEEKDESSSVSVASNTRARRGVQAKRRRRTSGPRDDDDDSGSDASSTQMTTGRRKRRSTATITTTTTTLDPVLEDNNNNNNDEDDPSNHRTVSQPRKKRKVAIQEMKEAQDHKHAATTSTTMVQAILPRNGSAVSSQDPSALAATAAATAVPLVAVPPIERLRPPSKQTPGRPKETKRLTEEDGIAIPPLPKNRLVFDKNRSVGESANVDTLLPATVTESVPQQRLSPPSGATVINENGTPSGVDHDETKHWFETACHQLSTRLERFNLSLSTWLGLNENERLSQYATRQWLTLQPHLTHAWVWFMLLLLLQLVCLPWIMHPLLSTIARGSNDALSWYKDMLVLSGTKPFVEQPSSHTTEMKDAWNQVSLMQQTLQDAREGLYHQINLLDTETKELKTLADRHHALVTRSMSGGDGLSLVLEQWKDNNDVSLTEDLLAAAQRILGPHASVLLNVSFLESWEIGDPHNCNIVEVDEEQEKAMQGVTMDNVLQYMADLREEANRLAEEMKEDRAVPETIRAWVLDAADEQVPNYRRAMDIIRKQKSKQESAASSGSLAHIRKMLQTRLDIEQADQTGRVDYASVLTGAAVIRSGEYATSPSLRDTLPVLNRMADRLALRFYGHGPEAALIPTHPPTAEGQCWSFQKDPTCQYANYALLTIRLAEPIQVRSISIEHADLLSSISSFRVFGFEEPLAEGKRWEMGSFYYERQTKSFRKQEFAMPSMVEDEEVPQLQAISIAIDSIWGAEYGCLYRVRVHGR